MVQRLTSDEKDLLALMVRNPDKVAWRAHYRMLKLPGHEGNERCIIARIRDLRARSEAKVFMQQQAREVEANRITAMQRADGAAWNREQARAELEENVYRLANAAVEEQLDALDAGRKAASPSQIAKLLEQAGKLAGRAGGKRKYSTEELRELAKQFGVEVPSGEGVVVQVRRPDVRKLPEAKA